MLSCKAAAEGNTLQADLVKSIFQQKKPGTSGLFICSQKCEVQADRLFLN